MNSLKNILIVRTDRIGDVVLSLPLAAILRKHFPGVRISFLVRDYTAPLIKNNKFVDEVLLTVMKAPKSYTREDIAEISCHGGPVPLKKTLEL